MIKVAIMFPVMGNCCSRWINSMEKCLPDDIEITQKLYRWTEYNHIQPDIVMTHASYSEHYPLLAMVSPKILFTEALDKYMMSYITDRDLVVTYNEGAASKLHDYNVLYQPRPVDIDLWYPEDVEKTIDIVSADTHEERLTIEVDKAIESLHGRHLVLRGPALPPLDVKASLDYCAVTDAGTRRIRNHYSSSKYIMSLCQERNFYGNYTVGWEVSNIEGLLCGARPICLKPVDVTYYDKFLGQYVIYIDANNAVNDVHKILSENYWRVTEEERLSMAAKVDSKKCWAELWDAVRTILNGGRL